MSIRPLLISALALSMSVRPCLSQEVHPRSAGISCDPCAIQFDTVAVIRSTPSTQITGTTFFERVGPYFVVADLLDGTRVRIFSSAGSLIGDLLGSDGVREFGQVQALRAVGEDSLAVFDAALKKLSILDISSGSGEEIDLPMAVSPGGDWSKMASLSWRQPSA